jgi:hypothetical protein
VWRQGNASSTRKQVAPLIVSFGVEGLAVVALLADAFLLGDKPRRLVAATDTLRPHQLILEPLHERLARLGILERLARLPHVDVENVPGGVDSLDERLGNGTCAGNTAR